MNLADALIFSNLVLNLLYLELTPGKTKQATTRHGVA